MDCFLDCCQNKNYSLNTSIKIVKDVKTNSNLINHLTTSKQLDNEKIKIGKENEIFNINEIEDEFSIIDYPELKSESSDSLNYYKDLAKIRGKSNDTDNCDYDNYIKQKNETTQFLQKDYQKISLLKNNKIKNNKEQALGSIPTKENSIEYDTNYIYSFRNPKKEMTINNYKQHIFSDIEENLSNNHSIIEKTNDYKKKNNYSKNNRNQNNKKKDSENKKILNRKISDKNLNMKTESITIINDSGLN